jgi:hypothetical protein
MGNTAGSTVAKSTHSLRQQLKQVTRVTRLNQDPHSLFTMLLSAILLLNQLGVVYKVAVRTRGIVWFQVTQTFVNQPVGQMQNARLSKRMEKTVGTTMAQSIHSLRQQLK